MASEIPVKTINLEVMLAGWQDGHNSGAKITFWLSDDADLEHFRMLTVKKGRTAGQRFMMVLAEINDDETIASAAVQPAKPKGHASSDAHLMITGAAFVSYCNEVADNEWGPEKTRLWAKHKMQIDSLSQLDTDPLALKRFHELIRRPFEQWMEHNGYGRETFGDDDA